jgi:hypothetical protein
LTVAALWGSLHVLTDATLLKKLCTFFDRCRAFGKAVHVLTDAELFLKDGAPF